MDKPGFDSENKLSRYLTTRSAWALAVGTSVGWGALIVTGSSNLFKAGPLGSVLGIIIGGLIMLLIGRNFAYLSNRYQDAGGIYTYTKNVFGYDRAFLVSWFLSLVYISMFWANATSIPLFVRYFFGDVFRFGYLYSIFGYDVFLGELILTAAAIALVTLLCMRSKTATAHVMTLLVFLFVTGITVCYAVSAVSGSGSGMKTGPLFAPDSSAASQIVRMVFISPWMFIGFESITHSAEEYTFRHKKLSGILVASVITTTLIYVFVTLLSVTAYPGEYSSWFEYLSDLDNPALKGINALPAFYAANHYLGTAGTVILSVSLFALIATSLIGNLRALSRLFYSLSKDDILPERFAKLNKKRIPARAMLLVSLISAVIPFLGRTAIACIVDVTTIGSTLIYGFVSAAAFKTAQKAGDRREKITGGLGFIIMLVFGVYLLMPGLFSNETLATETYFLLITWSILGFIYFRRIIAKDHARRFGKAIIVWIALLSLVVFLAIVWTDRIDESATNAAVKEVTEYYNGTADAERLAMSEEEFIAATLNSVHRTELFNTFVVMGLFALSLTVMLVNHFSMKKWEDKALRERDIARDVAYRDPMTGVKSKHAFVDKETEIDKRIEDGTAGGFRVLVCDINGLKKINDTLGHKAGDEYIRAASQMICGHFKHSPVYRIGGDEFAVIPEGRDYTECESILAEINKQFEANIGTIKVVAAIGSADYIPEKDVSFHSVFERADAEMYRRKQQLKYLGATVRD